MIGTLQLSFGSLALSAASSHPNKMQLKGVLLILDEVSTKAPNGSDGHRILVPSEVAQKRLSTIVGMGLNYKPTLDGHAQRRKVGVIDRAWIDGSKFCVEATVWKHDFPEAEEDLKRSNLGMSMEIGEVHVEDTGAPVWKITDFKFLGATVLDRDAAAYRKTMAIAASKEKRKTMAVTTKKEKIGLTTEQIAAIAAQAAQEAVRPLVSTLDQHTDILASLNAKLEEQEIEAATGIHAEEIPSTITTKPAPSPGTTPPPTVTAKKEEDEEEEDEEDDDEMEGEGINKGDLEEMGPGVNDEDDDDPGHLNKDAKSKGNKTTSEDEIGKNVSKAVTGAAYTALKKKVITMAAQFKQVVAENAKLKKQLSRVDRQVTAAAAETNRRSLPAELIGLLKKHELDPIELRASGQPLTVNQVDAILNDVGGLDPTKRIELKNKFLGAGLMEDGRVERGITIGR
jgi:hypothetical protein